MGTSFTRLLAGILSPSAHSVTPVRGGRGAPGRRPHGRGGPPAPGVLGPGLTPQAGVRWRQRCWGAPPLSRLPSSVSPSAGLEHVTSSRRSWGWQNRTSSTCRPVPDGQGRQARAFFPNMVGARSGLWASPRPSEGGPDPGGAPQLKLAGQEAQAHGPSCVRPPPGSPAGRTAHPGCPLGSWGAFTMAHSRKCCKFKEAVRDRRDSCYRGEPPMS